MSSKDYFYVGLITLLLTFCLSGLILWKNSVFTRIQSYTLIGEFNSVNGLLTKAVVKYRGYPVGRVTRIIPKSELIEVKFFVDEKYQIPTGSTVKIVFDGLVGEKYMEIAPNPHSDVNFKDGDRIYGYSTPGLADFIDVGTQNLLELKSILNTMAAVFGNEEISFALKEVVFSMRDTAKNMEKVINELQKISGSSKVSNILTELEELTTNLNAALTKEDIERISSTIENLESFSNNLKEFLEDDEFKENLVSTIKETRDTFKQSSSFLNTISRIQLLTSADFSYNDQSSGIIYDLNFDFWLDNSYLNFGFSNYSEEDKLMNVQLSVPFNSRIRFRYGLIKSSPGMGFDYYFKTIPLLAAVSMYEFGDPNFDIILKYSILNYLSINTGYNEINQDTRNWLVGISIIPGLKNGE